MSKHHKHISLLLSSVLIVAVMSGFFLMSQSGFRQISTFGVAKVMTLQDYTLKSLDVDKILFTIPEKGEECMLETKDDFNSLMLMEPKQLEKYDVNGKNGFANYIYTSKYDSGIIKIKKNSEEKQTAEIFANRDKLIFTKYADKYKTIQLNLTLRGEIKDKTFLITNGEFNSEGNKCGFE